MKTMKHNKISDSVKVTVPLTPPLSSFINKSHPALRSSHVSDSCCACMIFNNNINNFKRSANPKRFMFYSLGTWLDFQTHVVEILRAGFLEGKPLIDVVIEGSKYVFDFVRMVQIDFGSGNQRSIAWIDEEGKPFFPRVFIDEDCMENSGVPKIEVEIRVGGILGKRKFDTFDSNEVSSSVKDYCKWPNAKLVSEEESVYSFVSFLFLSEMSKAFKGVTISAIHGFEFSGRREIFERCSKNKEATRGVSNTVYAWYGASAETVEGILSHGFVLPAKTSGYPAYGVGVHLSHLGFPQLSAMKAEEDNKGEKHIILCRVVLGKIEKVADGSQMCRPSSVEYDTGADDPLNPKWYVVWSNDVNSHILPECVISFKSSAHLPGQLGAKNSLVNLLRKMNGRIPSIKLKEIITLYRSALAGKLAKDIFLGQLRAIAGDELLVSIFREMRCTG